MSKTRTALFGLVLLLQVLYLGSTTLFQEHHLATGRTALLETVPVDPRDLLRGDYVTLRYAINRLPRELFDPPIEAGVVYAGQEVYVVLEKQGDFFTGVRASLSEPEVQAGELIIKGTARNSDDVEHPAPVEVEYGIEQYYVREGTGNPQGKLTVLVSVQYDGVPLIKEVYVDGVPFAEAMRGQASQL